MRIPRSVALLIGVATVWPIVYMFIFMSFALTSFLSSAHGGSGTGPMESFFGYIFVAHLGTMLLMLGLMGFYLVHVFRNAAFKDERRVLWAILVFVGGPLGMSVYWWLYVWRGPATADQSGGAA
jgi:hypothetical protein